LGIFAADSAGWDETQAGLFTEGNCEEEEKMKLHLFQGLLALNEEFGQAIHAWP
jgi:hypothetical protein